MCALYIKVWNGIGLIQNKLFYTKLKKKIFINVKTKLTPNYRVDNSK